MKKNQNTLLRGKLPLLVTALSIAYFSSIYQGGRKSGSKINETSPAVSGIQTKSKRTMDRLAEDRNHPGNTSSPVALWPAPVSITQEAPAPTTTQKAQHDHADHEAAEPAKSRRATFAANSLAALGDLKKGDSVVIPLMDGQKVSGRVNLVQPDENGWVRVGGELSGADTGSFTMGSDGKEVAAIILLPNKDLAYEVSGMLASNATMEEKPLSEALCSPLPASAPERAATTSTTSGTLQAAPPILSSRPSATAVVYMDFDGETVTDPHWNNGNTIVAAPSALNGAQITQVWQRVSEDFAPFNIDITTDVSRYNNAPVGSRMRCIVTPTNTAAPGSGGVAYLQSFDRAGSSFSSTIPCWAFNGGVDAGSETISHEVGHTLGLTHDGSPAGGYYYGHGTGDVSWGPIMGASFGQSVTQWSKGEYLNANQQQDDIAIIANATNGFGFVPDETGDTPVTAAPLNAPGGTVSQTGIITQASDSDSYVINVQAGTVNITATPFVFYPNLDILLELQNANGVVIASANPDLALNASISQNVAAGVYYVKVKGTGRGDVLGTGYSSYGSIGNYTLTGTLPSGSVPLAPVITSASSASGVQGKPFTYQITATNSPTSYSATGLPAGLTINSSSGLISGTPSAAGASNIALWATNAAGTGSGSLALTVTTNTTSTGNSNTSPIAITDNKTNTTTINVSGVTGTVTKVTVKLDGLTHTWPDDVDVVLVGPGGQKVMLMSDMGGSYDISNVVLTFSDSVASTLPDSTKILAGTYKPGNIGTETLRAPAPAGPYGTSLGVFNGLNPNGAWRLYVGDDAGSDTGSIARGWSLVFTTSASLVKQGTIKWSQPDGSTTIWKLDNQNRYTGEFTTVGSR
jgi:subtilisin-like proprotein convertase family protein